MRRFVSIRSVLTVLVLVVVWCAFWGSVSIANVASGVVVAIVASMFGNDSSRRGIRPVPLLHLFWVILVDLVVSTAVVLREVVTPVDDTDEAIIAVPIDAAGRGHLLLLYIAITLTPGTAVVAGADDASTIYLHVLHADRREAVEEHVHLLARLADGAFPNAVVAP